MRRSGEEYSCPHILVETEEAKTVSKNRRAWVRQLQRKNQQVRPANGESLGWISSEHDGASSKKAVVDMEIGAVWIRMRTYNLGNVIKLDSASPRTPFESVRDELDPIRR
jgi:hypothetical protein